MRRALPKRARRRLPASDDSAAPRERRRGRRAIDFLARLGFELLIIFVGVYAAFALSQHRAEREADRRQHQIREALIAEIEAMTVNTRRVASDVPRYLTHFDSLISVGQRPVPQPFLEPVNVQAHMWETTLQSNALDLLDVPTVYRLSGFYNSLNQGFEQIHQLRSLTEQFILPALDEGVEGFYRGTSGELRPSFAWYRPGLRRLGNLAAEITAMGDSLVVDLRRENETLN